MQKIVVHASNIPSKNCNGFDQRSYVEVSLVIVSALYFHTADQPKTNSHYGLFGIVLLALKLCLY